MSSAYYHSLGNIGIRAFCLQPAVRISERGNPRLGGNPGAGEDRNMPDLGEDIAKGVRKPVRVGLGRRIRHADRVQKPTAGCKARSDAIACDGPFRQNRSQEIR